ncbi:hypothetical protein GH754_06990 [Salinibacillus xinjiangensis]|uniref:Uncharacterized protein n=1 Tax=Salinibacillus xinjiangensis TaxID=1229268 RepID=A0A6G1X4Z6_9BACI|nr:hypothetical protein [Salinibacillus xinjiangensis]
MKKLFKILMIVLVLSIGFLIIRFGSALTQEGNPIPILTSIAKLELSNRDYQLVTETSNESTYISQNVADSDYLVIKQFMEDHGWGFKEQLGSGLVFVKDNETRLIETRLYSKHYFLWSVPRMNLAS